MKSSFLLIVLLVRSWSANAQELSVAPSIQRIQPLPFGVVTPNYAGPRIGDIAPQFTLAPLVPRADDKSWSLRDELGKHSTILVMFGASPVLVGKNMTPQKVVSGIAQASAQLKERGVTVVAVSHTQGISLKGLDAGFDALTLQDSSGALERAFSISPTAITLVSIDRAGFLRNVETVKDPATIAARLILQSDSTPTLGEGQTAPDFSLSDMHGQVRRLSELRGRKNLLLTFFPKCFTGGCANHLTALQGESEALAAANVEIWAVSIDPASGERGQIAFAESLGLTFPLLPDEGRNVSLLYGTARKPNSTPLRRTFLIDKNGVVRFVDKNIQVFTHGTDMLAKIRELGLASQR